MTLTKAAIKSAAYFYPRLRGASIGGRGGERKRTSPRTVSSSSAREPKRKKREKKARSGQTLLREGAD